MIKLNKIKKTIEMSIVAMAFSVCILGCGENTNKENNVDNVENVTETSSSTDENKDNHTISISQSTTQSMTTNSGLGRYHSVFQGSFYSKIDVPLSLSNITKTLGNDYKKEGTDVIIYTWQLPSGDKVQAFQKSDASNKDSIYDLRCTYAENSIHRIDKKLDDLSTNFNYSYDELASRLGDKGMVVQVYDDGNDANRYYKVIWYGRDKECTATFSFMDHRSRSITIS